MLRLTGITKIYQGHAALKDVSLHVRSGRTKDVSLHVRSGRTVVVIGPSGCGKSTILRLVAGLVWPDTGSITIASQELSRSNVSSLRRRIGYVIQEGGLFPHLSARDNVALLGRYLDWPRPQIEQRVAELADLVRLPKLLLARYPDELSGGQRQRVALMRALLADPDILLLDEPLGALDPMVRYELQADLKELFRTLGKSTLMVTHDMSEAAWFGDQIVLLKEGRVVQIGSADDLARQPSEPFVSDFIRAQRRPFNDGQI